MERHYLSEPPHRSVGFQQDVNPEFSVRPHIEVGNVSGKVLPADLNAIQLKLLSAGGAVSQGVVFSLSNFSVRRAWLREWTGRARPGPGMECLFSSFVQSGPESYPKTIDISDRDKRRITLTNDEVDFKTPLKGDLFEMDIPPGIEIRELK